MQFLRVIGLISLTDGEAELFRFVPEIIDGGTFVILSLWDFMLWNPS